MEISSAASKLWCWLQTWLDGKGGLHGYVVHHYGDNLKILSPDMWTQSPAILGLLRLFQKTKQEKWLRLASRLCDFLVDRYDQEIHMYLVRNHGDWVLSRPGLIHPTLASYALLEVAQEKRKQGDEWRAYYNAARDNIDHFLLPLWDENVGALRDPSGEIKHVHNMNSVAMLALLALSRVEENDLYVEKYVKRIADYILSCQVKKGKLAGAIPYRDSVKNYITLYTLITTMGLYTLYKRNGDPKLITCIKKAINNLGNFIDEKTNLVSHFHRHGFPQWIPDTFLFVLTATRLRNEDVKINVSIERILDSLLQRQYKNGGFPLSIGFEDMWYPEGLPSRPHIKRWRDVLPTPNWNTWNFWALTELLPENVKIREPTVEFPLTIKTDREELEGPYLIIEERDKVRFVTVRDGTPVGIFIKTRDIADLCSVNEREYKYWRSLKPLEKYPKFFLKMIYRFSKYLG